MWFVYIIQSSKNNKLYTGITTDLVRRLQEHNSGKKGAKYTKTGRPWLLVYSEEYPNRSSASIREAEIKKMSRENKLKLIGV
jgi:putative endonuclease